RRLRAHLYERRAPPGHEPVPGCGRIPLRALLHERSLPARQRLPRFTGDGAVDLPISEDACPADARPHGRGLSQLHLRIQITAASKPLVGGAHCVVGGVAFEPEQTMDCRAPIFLALLGTVAATGAGCTPLGSSLVSPSSRADATTAFNSEGKRIPK